jgi:transcriptional repressor NrdR
LRTIEIKSNIIGEKIMDELKKLDKVAYIRFASVYREFADVTDFQEELRVLINEINRETKGNGN